VEGKACHVMGRQITLARRDNEASSTTLLLQEIILNSSTVTSIGTHLPLITVPKFNSFRSLRDPGAASH
jgi:hypothetical protein